MIKEMLPSSYSEVTTQPTNLKSRERKGTCWKTMLWNLASPGQMPLDIGKVNSAKRVHNLVEIGSSYDVKK